MRPPRKQKQFIGGTELKKGIQEDSVSIKHEWCHEKEIVREQKSPWT